MLLYKDGLPHAGIPVSYSTLEQRKPYEYTDFNSALPVIECLMFNIKPHLPAPSAALKAHSQGTQQALINAINAEGSIDFATFMQIALYGQPYGYYTSGLQKFGRAGDFITAPEISPLFSRTLAHYVAKIATHCSSPVLLECGPGSGKMMCDILLHLEYLHALPTTYYCLELSASLKARQYEQVKQTCPHLLSRIVWLDTLPSQPFEGIILANEVLDALPVHLFELNEHGLQERRVSLVGHELCWQLAPVADTLAETLGTLIKRYQLKPPYQFEYHALFKPWLCSLKACLAKGVITLIDYGFLGDVYYHPQRNTGTFMCHYQHHNHTNPFFLPGACDITAHVNFSALMEEASALGLKIIEFDTQANFLIRHGILEEAEKMMAKDAKNHIQYSQALQTLLFPHEMGELFNILSLSKNIPAFS